jgi:3-demethoxyubiquinol 3-hydroxylase
MGQIETKRLICRILRVDHAGEHGAIAIYGAQIASLGRRDRDLAGWLGETLAHEQRHRHLFRQAMPERGAKPCRALIIWSIGGAVLGRLTAMLGRDAVMACTEVVERTVHRHLLEQIRFLDRTDPALAALVRDIQIDEDEHLAYAAARHDRATMLSRLIEILVSSTTELLIALSTRGDSLRLSRTLAELA